MSNRQEPPVGADPWAPPDASSWQSRPAPPPPEPATRAGVRVAAPPAPVPEPEVPPEIGVFVPGGSIHVSRTRRALRAMGVAIFLGVLLFGAVTVGRKVLTPLLEADRTDPCALTGTPGTPVEFSIPEGASAESIAETLDDADVIADRCFNRAVLAQQVSAQLKPGSYTLVQGMTADAVLAALIEGPPPAFESFTAIEGSEYWQIAESIEASTHIAAAVFLDAVVNNTHAFEAEEAAARPEAIYPLTGFLYPNTYHIGLDATADGIVQQMMEEFDRQTAHIDWAGASERLGLSPYEMITVASLIEAETRFDAERPLVASVIYNRLAAGEILGIDATVQFIVPGPNTLDLTQADLDRDSQYNTRRYPGLPPGPICTPRIASIEAAVNPAETNYFYYVIADEDGNHAFAETAEEFEELKQAALEAGLLTEEETTTTAAG